MTGFADRLAAAVAARQTPLVVGLDPRAHSLPESLQRQAAESRDQAAAAYERFCCEVIDVVAPLAPAVKPQAAFFEQLGPAGMRALGATVQHARRRGLLVILDGKRNDIGSTAAAYAEAYLGADSPWGADCLTVSPYLGEDSLTPFVEAGAARNAGIFVLVKTSNPGGGLFQDRVADGRPLYRHVAELVERFAAESAGPCGYSHVGAVVGATYPAQLGELREAMPHTWFLVPGFGAQGGGAADVLPAFDSQGLGAVVNSSRAIIFAYQKAHYAGLDWQDAVRKATEQAIHELPACGADPC